jgi:hypothetical protein
MKTLFTTLILLFFASGVFSQEKTEPDKQTTTIFLKVSDDAKTAYKNFGRLILDNGFMIEKSDADFLTITTQQKSLAKHPGWSHTWFFNAKFSDNKITIQPLWLGNIEISFGAAKSTNSATQWNYVKSKMDIRNMIYEELMELVAKYPNAEISFN